MNRQIFLITILFGVVTATMFIFIGVSSAINPVAMWLMDEGTGKEIHDEVGKHTGEFLGNPNWVAGKIGKGVHFNGAPDHIEVPDPDHKLTPKHITMMCWLNLDNTSGNHSILEQYDWVDNLGTHAWRTEGTLLAFYPIWGTDAPFAKGDGLKAGEWMHVAATYDGADIKVWINGKVAGEGTDAQKRDLIPSNKTLSFGVRGDTKDVHWMQGVLDEVAIFDVALAEKDIQSIMNNPKGLKGTAVSPKSKLTITWGSIKR